MKSFALKVGPLMLRSPVTYAPLVSYTDYPFRQMASQFSPGLMFCEMLKIESLIRYTPSSKQVLAYSEEMRPIGAQICTGSLANIVDGVQIIEDHGFDLIDLNCGCPTDRIVKDGSGSGLLKNPALLGAIVEKMVTSTSLPVTVKIRAGWDQETINIPLITAHIEDAGAVAICIHGRTRSQGFKGPANHDFIKQCKDASKNIPIFGNGDVLDGPSAAALMANTGCDGVAIGRGSMGAPWKSDHIAHFLKYGEERVPISFEESKKLFFEHLTIVKSFYNSEERTLIEAKKLCGHYLQGVAGCSQLRRTLATFKSSEGIFELLDAVEG
ncbi:tRNA-dihydrouridine synthase B [Candidatus Clavichlamydia salmonicola]|uniref:tRNA dihydrouridine synthase DusB n=1 Tax=Candidatus Clavichlamydia salmonicola TaxID=469812 RepID=UPI001891C245|nr:tRNA dihydrouridine synthase DusB [Candidatus Clavichlamydia salmonicola]MBF5050636.1 tRNA-dihydrouridine synthase B [Candidatus Clavichlamydia salmonicola]